MIAREVLPKQSDDIEELSACFSKVAQAAVAATVPETKATPKRPWISSGTLDLIQQRNMSRTRADRASEVELNKQIARSAKKDREEWLRAVASSGSWNAVKMLRKPKHPPRGKLRNANVDLVESWHRVIFFLSCCFSSYANSGSRCILLQFVVIDCQLSLFAVHCC